MQIIIIQLLQMKNILFVCNYEVKNKKCIYNLGSE